MTQTTPTPTQPEEAPVDLVQPDEAQAAKIAQLLSASPHLRPQLIERFRQRGIDVSATAELMDTGERLSADLQAFGQGLTSGLSLGIAETGETPFGAHKVDVPVLGEMSAGGAAGEFVGAIIPSLMGYGLATKGLQGVSALSKAPKIRQFMAVALGEGGLGAATGAAQSDFDPTHMAKMAGMFMAAGVVGEGVGRVAIRAFKKMSKARDTGSPPDLTPEETNALVEVGEEVASQPGRADAAVQEVAEMKRLLNASEEAVDGPDFRTRAAHIMEQAKSKASEILPEVPDGMADRMRAQLDPIWAGLSNGTARLGETTNALYDQMKRSLQESGMPIDRVDELAGAYGEVMRVGAQLVERGAIAASDVDELLRSIMRGATDKNEVIRQLHQQLDNITEVTRGKFYDRGTGEGHARIKVGETYSIRTTGDVLYPNAEVVSRGDGIIEILTENGNKTEYIPMEDVATSVHRPAAGGGAPTPGEGHPMTSQQAKEIAELEVEIRQNGGDMSDAWDGSDLTLEGARARIDDLKRRKVDTYNARSEEMASDFTGRVDDGPAQVPDSEFKDVPFPWLNRFKVPYSRWSLGGNPVTKPVVDYSLRMMERIGRDSHQILERYSAIVAPLSEEIASTTGARATLGNRAAQAALSREKMLKIQLFRALESSNPESILTAHPGLRQPYQELRALLDEMADAMGLPKGDPLRSSMPKIFDGQTGAWRAQRLGEELGTRARFFTEAGDPTIPRSHYVANLRTKGPQEMFNQDLDAAMYAYLRGVVQKVEYDKFLRRVHNARAQIPVTDKAGKPYQISQTFDDWVTHILGKPTQGRQHVARWFRNNEVFNTWIDNLVESLGDAELKGIMGKARLGRDGQGYRPGDEADALNFFNQLVDDANKFTREGVYKRDGSTSRQMRANLALAVDDIRNALGDPNLRAPIISQLYHTMVLNKLGFNLVHGLVNSTQVITNTVPIIGARWASKGVKHYIDSDGKMLHGKTVKSLLDEAGVLLDTPEALDFIPGRVGAFSALSDAALAPARISEQFARGSTFLGAYDKLLTDGLNHTEAMGQAVDIVQKTQFPFNRAGAPPIMHSAVARLMLMFKNYTMHQLNFSAELLHDAIIKGEYGPLFKHVTAYVAMGGVGATMLGGTTLGQGTEHPGVALMTAQSSSDVQHALMGPAAISMLHLLEGQVGEAAEEWAVSTAKKRAYRATTEEGLSLADRALVASGITR